jgi:hypothetical protein
MAGSIKKPSLNKDEEAPAEPHPASVSSSVAVMAPVISSSTATTQSSSSIDGILQRLNRLEEENVTLKAKVQRLEEEQDSDCCRPPSNDPLSLPEIKYFIRDPIKFKVMTMNFDEAVRKQTVKAPAGYIPMANRRDHDDFNPLYAYERGSQPSNVVEPSEAPVPSGKDLMRPCSHNERTLEHLVKSRRAMKNPGIVQFIPHLARCVKCPQFFEAYPDASNRPLGG